MYAIKVGSVTNAQRGAKILRSKGYKPLISRAENPQHNDGCGYVIKINAQSKTDVLKILKANGIAITGVEEL